MLTARADDSVAELKAKLSQTYEGKPPAERQTVRVGSGREEEKMFSFSDSNGPAQRDRSACLISFSLIIIIIIIFRSFPLKPLFR